MKVLALLVLIAAPSASLATIAPALSQPGVPATIAYAQYATLMSQEASSPINVRDGASTNAYARHIGYAGDRVEILDRIVGRDGYMWYQVRFVVSNATGWIRGDFLALDQ